MIKKPLMLLTVFIFVILMCGAVSAGNTTKISSNSTGGNTNSASYNSAVSADGRYIVYESDASNIVLGDTNGWSDIFLYDRLLNKTIRANRGPANAQAVGGSSSEPSISADGRYITYYSYATNLVPEDTNGVADVFLYDRVLSKTIRANRGPANAQAVAGDSFQSKISGDGRYIVYASTATNLVPGDTNMNTDIFLYDRVLNKTIRANRGPANAQAVGGPSSAPSISANGRFIVYESWATNLVPGDSNEVRDIFLYDTVLNKTIRANRGPANAQAIGGHSYNSVISADGRYIVYTSLASNLVQGDTNTVSDIFLYDRVLNKTIRANRGPANAQAMENDSLRPSISADGRYIVYVSAAANLISGDTNGDYDIFLYDRILNITIRANRGPANVQANDFSINPFISANGRYITYESTANNLVQGDTNGRLDVFLYIV